MNDVSVNSPDDSEIFTFSTTTIDSTLGFFNVSNVNYINDTGTYPLVIDIVSLQNNPQ